MRIVQKMLIEDCIQYLLDYISNSQEDFLLLLLLLNKMQ